MLKKITAGIDYPDWASEHSRYRRLDILDRLLDGTIYNHLSHSFYDEVQPNTDRYIPLVERRPSVQYGLPQLIAKTVSRKLFAGRHRPIFIKASNETLSEINKFIDQANVYEKMLQAAFWGSVGSVAVTFSFVDKKLRLDIWRAKWCHPSFDDCQCLSKLRVAYITTGTAFISTGITADAKGQDITHSDKYWWIRDYDDTSETTFLPIPENSWNPYTGKKELEVVPKDGVVEHNLGFIPAEWMANLSGGILPDGSCTWDIAIPISIEIDYTLSQLGRGVRYNSSPELVVKGELENYEDGAAGSTVIRGPVNMLKFKSGYKDSEGVNVEGGDAKLLEMTGNGTNVGLTYVDKLRKYALETLTAVRKDPEQMHGPLSGRAMELVDEEFIDMVQELRTAYGDRGILALMKKVMKGAIIKRLISKSEDYEEISLHWPRVYIPTPLEALQIVQAITMATEQKLITNDGYEIEDFLRAQLDFPLRQQTEDSASPDSDDGEAAKSADKTAKSSLGAKPDEVVNTELGDSTHKERVDA